MALIAWRDLHARRYPELGLLVAIPNGGYRNAREAARLKRMGVRAGVSDYFLAVPRPPKEPGGCDVICGVWIELKSPKGKLSPAQKQWFIEVERQCYGAVVCYGWLEAARGICDYLGLTGSVRP